MTCTEDGCDAKVTFSTAQIVLSFFNSLCTCTTFRRELEELAMVFLLDSDSSESSSDEDIETTAVLIDSLFPEVDHPHRTRVCLEDLDDSQCERLFR